LVHECKKLTLSTSIYLTKSNNSYTDLEWQLDTRIVIRRNDH
jgi:hypothetical protein